MAPKHKPKNNNKPKNTPSNNTKRQDHSDSSSSGVNKTSNNTMSEPNVGRSLNSNNQANSNNGNNNIRRNTSTSSITSTDSNSSNDGSNSPLPNQRRNNINPSNSKKNNNLSNNNSISPTSPSNHQTKRRQHVPPPLNTNLTPKPSERIELVWTSVKTSFKPPVRGFHSCTLVGDKLYIIGGDNRVEHFKDVWIYDLKNNYWIKITENSHLPMPRTGHSAVLYQDKVYLFGGKNENYYTSDLFIYDLKDKVWVKDVQPHNKKVSLTPRAAHSCCCVDDKMYIFGGITSYQANDGRKASEYIDVLSMYDISQRRWKKPKNKGTAPSARAGHSCCVINRDIYIFGGRQGTILFNDLYKYNVDSEKWTKIQTKGDAPQPSAGHTMSAYVDKIVILGGSDWKTYPTEIYVFHIPSKVWIKCMSLGITTGRFWHTATVYDDNLYVYGGGTGELVDDMYCINLRSLNNISEATALTPQSSASPVPLPEIPVQTFTSTLKFKTIYKAEMRVFAKVPRDVTYLELKETISKSYGFPVVLKYVELDDEKDEITIGSDRELKDFIECFEEMGKGLRLELSEQKAREPESDTDSNSETDHEEDMQSTTDGIKWRKGGLLGKGAYGEVYKGLNVNTGQWMAVKIIDLSATSEKEQKLVEKQIFNEINLMKDLCHENIVRYLGAEFNRKKTRLFIYIELVDGGSLSEILKNVGPLDESVVRQYTRQILFGLKYLHDKNIIHRDIKGGNILIETKSGTIKLADFGHSKKITENVQASLRICGTPMWMAPEIIKESKYSKASDIWSVACTIIEMLTAEVPFPDLVSFENTGVMFKIATGAVPKIPENLSEEGKLFLGKCFSQNPNSRPTVDDLLHEPFLRSLRYVGVSYPNDETSSEEEEEEDDEFPSIDNSSYEEDTNSFDKGKRPISTESEEFDGMENPNPNNKGKGPLVEDEEDEDEDFTDEDEDEDEDFSDDESESSYSEDKSSQSITQQLRNIQANNPILSMGLRGNLPTQSQVAQVAQLRRAPPPLVSTPSTGTLRGVLRNDIQMNPYIAQTVTQVAATPSTTLNIGSSASHSKTVTKSACDNDVMSFLQTKKQSNQ